MSSEEMTYRDRLFAALDQSGYDRVPCPGVTQTGTVDLMEASGAYWPDAHRDAEKMARLAWAAYEHAGLEGIRIPFIVYTEASAFGTKLYKWKRDVQPMIEDLPVKSPEDIDKLEVPDPRGAELPSVVLKAIEILKPKCDAEKLPLTVMVMAPVTMVLIGALADAMKVMMWVKTNINDVVKLAKKASEMSLAFAEAVVDAGADVIFYNVGPSSTVKEYPEVFFPIDREVAGKIRKMGVYMIAHHCADPRRIMNELVGLGVHGLSIPQPQMIPVREARELVGDRVALVGGMDQLHTLIKKSPEDVMEQAKVAIEEGIDVLAPGCGFGPKTPLANMRAMVEAAKKYGHLARLARK